MPEGAGSPDIGPPKTPPTERAAADSSAKEAQPGDLTSPEARHRNPSPEALIEALKSGDPDQMAEAGNRITLMQEKDLPPFDPTEALMLGHTGAATPAAGGPPSPERRDTLRGLDHEVLMEVKQLGDFEENSVKSRIGVVGRRILEGIQRRIANLHERRMTKAVNDLGAARKAALDAEKAIKERAPERLEKFKEILEGLRIKKDDRHEGFETRYSTSSIAELDDEARELAIDYKEWDERTALDVFELQRLLAAGDPGEDDPAGHIEYLANRRALEELEIKRREDLGRFEKQRNSALYLKALKELEEPGNELLIPYWEAEQRYIAIRSERKASSDKEVEAGLAFKGEKDFKDALDIAEGRATATPTEKAEAKEIVESYFKEAGRRGYLSQYNATMADFLGPIQEAMAARGQRISLSPEQLARARLMVDRLKAQANSITRVTLENGTVVDMTNVEYFIHREIEGGRRRGGIDPDAVKFNEVVLTWLDRMDKYVVDLAGDSRADNLYNGEFTLRAKGKGWYISEYGTPVVERYSVTTKEDFEACMWSYADFLTGGSIDRAPQQLFQKLQQFSEFFQGLAADRFPQYAPIWRHQLKAFVGAYAAEYFASLANTPNMEAALTETFREADGIDVLPAAFMAMDGQVGLSVRLMNRMRRFRPLHRYSGENGGVAFHVTTGPDGHQNIATGTLEYIVRDNTETLLAQEVMIYELSESFSGESVLAPRGQSERDSNLLAVANYQTTAELIDKYTVNKRTLRIRDAIRYGHEISDDDKAYYQEKLDRAVRAVTFARRIEVAMGERALKASPSYIVPIYKRSKEGRLLDREGRVITITEVKKENPAAKDMWWVNRLRKKIPAYITERIRSGDPVVERVDYLDELGSIKYMQFVDNLARIMAEKENEKAQAAYTAAQIALQNDPNNPALKERLAAAEVKLRPMNAWEIRRRANRFRDKAKEQLWMHGYGARILDEHGDEIYFEMKGVTKGSDYQDGTRANLDSAKTRREFRDEAMKALGLGVTVTAAEFAALTPEQSRVLVQKKYDSLTEDQKADVELRTDELIRGSGFQALDFDQASTHVLANWNGQTYLGYQQEIKSQLLSSKVRMEALKIRRGEMLPEEADPLASLLLQIDPTLTRLRPSAEDKPHLKIINACVAESFSKHFRIKDELALQFSRRDGSINSYYGIPNERFSWKELLWSADKLNREPERFGRRGYLLFNRSPVHAFSFAEGFGGDLAMAVGTSVTRRDEFVRMYDKEITDSNVYAGWIARINRAYAVLVRLAKGGQLGNEAVVPLGLKPFNDLDSMTGRIKAAFQNGEGHHGFLEAFRKCLGRLEATLKSIESQDNVTGESGAFRIEAADVRYVKVENGVRTYVFPQAGDRNVVYDYAEICFYDKNGKPIKDERKSAREKGEIWRRLDQQNVTTDVGQGAWSAKDFLYSSFIPYSRENGPEDYPREAWAIELTEGMEVWRYIDSKAINTGEGGR